MRYPFTLSDILSMVERVHTDRAVFHNDSEDLAPGLSVHHVGGHTQLDLQVLRVHTARGWVVLASDASHFYANMENQRPFPIIYNTVDMLEGYKTCLQARQFSRPRDSLAMIRSLWRNTPVHGRNSRDGSCV